MQDHCNQGLPRVCPYTTALGHAAGPLGRLGQWVAAACLLCPAQWCRGEPVGDAAPAVSRCLSLPLPLAPAASCSRCLSLPLPLAPAASCSRCLLLPLALAASRSRCLLLPLPLIPAAYCSSCFSLQLPLAPAGYRSHCLSLLGTFGHVTHVTIRTAPRGHRDIRTSHCTNSSQGHTDISL